MATGFESGMLVYLDARANTNEGEGHAFHMTVGRIMRRMQGYDIFLVNLFAAWPMWFSPGSLVPCLNKRGPFFVGDVVFGTLLRDHDWNCESNWCTCHAVGQIVATHSRGIDVDFAYGQSDRHRLPKIIRMRRSDVRLATKGEAHRLHEEIQDLIKPVAATCRNAAAMLRLQQSDRTLACCRVVVGF